MEKNGSLSINSENIFPIIKKWLYSDHDIFYRELVSNGCDAITKLKKLEMMGECELADEYSPKILVSVNSTKKTIEITDNGLGMDADEIEQYINQIAFSGASDFLAKYKDKANEDQIIGHFGLGFYSAFMVADKVHIDSLSYKEGATAVHWECDGGTEFTLSDGDMAGVGTKITLFLNEDCLEFANKYRAEEVLQKYCSFMPYPIFLEKADEPPKEVKEGEDAKEPEEPKPLNNVHPLWAKTPSECTEEEYKNFYRDVFHDYKEPLFWIHLNMDYPFNLKGILYFPKINMEYESLEGTIKLYNNQVFIADNIKEVIPEYFMLLKGTIDCPDLPLNVSRSALQNDGFVTKIQEYISKKVADKLSGMCKTDRETYEKFWDDISPFIKYGCLKDEKFCERMNDFILFKDLEDKYITLPELLVKEEKEDSEEPKEATETEDSKVDSDAEDIPPEDKRKTIYYVTDRAQQGQYIKMFKSQGTPAVILDAGIDTSFITQLEMKNENYKFERIDSGINENMVEDSDADLAATTETLSEIFKKALDNDKLNVNVKQFKDATIASVITLSESSRRMSDMMKMYSMPGLDADTFGRDETLILNAGNDLVKYILDNKDGAHTDLFCKQLYDLATIANGPLAPDKMEDFIKRSNEIMMLLAK